MAKASQKKSHKKIADGRMDKWYEEIVLMEQPFIKDDSKTIGELLQETVAEVGETVVIGEFKRIAIGEVDEADEE